MRREKGEDIRMSGKEEEREDLGTKPCQNDRDQPKTKRTRTEDKKETNSFLLIPEIVL